MARDRHADIAGLREAVRLVREHWDALQQRKDRDAATQLIEAQIARLEGGDARACVDCESPFYLTTDDLDFFDRKGLSLPRRCRSCRAARRQDRSTREQRAPV